MGHLVEIDFHSNGNSSNIIIRDQNKKSIGGAFNDLVPFAKFKKREKHPCHLEFQHRS